MVNRWRCRVFGSLLAASLIGVSGIGGIELPGASFVGTAEARPISDDSVVLDISGLPMRGNPDGIVTIVEFSDYECPFCNRAEPTLDQLLKDYLDDLRIVFAHMPLTFHKNAEGAAKAARAAQLQGKFWEMHKKLFENQKTLHEGFYIETAKELGLDIEQFKADMNSSETAAYIKKCSGDASRAGLSGTPSFLINGVEFIGAQPIDNFRKKIEEARSRAKDVAETKKLSGDALYKELVRTAPSSAPLPGDEEAKEDRIYIADDKSPVLGSAKAPVTIVEFTDFQCPFCRRANDTLHTLIKNNPDKVRVVFKHYPLPFHQNAELAARAAEAAKKQGKFWEYHDILFENQRALSREDLIGYAKQLKLNEKKFIEYMDGPESLGIVKQDIESGTNNGVRGTPHFFFNGAKFSGAQPLPKFQDMLDDELRIADGYKKKKLTGQKLYAQIVKDNPDAPQKPAKAGDDSAPAPSGPRKLISESYAPTRGSAKAPITLVVYEDYECPFSKRANETVKKLVENNPNKIRVVFKHYPLDFHSHAKLAHKAAAAAHKQGKFLEYRDMLYENQKNLEREDLIAYARKLKLNEKKFVEYMDGPEALGLLQMNMDEGKNIDIKGTPNFLFNGRAFSGAQPLDAFQNVVDQELKLAEFYAKKKLTGRKLYEQIVKDNVGIDDDSAPVKPSILGMPYKGAADAPVTIIEYSDFQCPFCKRASQTVDELLKLPEYQGKIKVVFKQLPLEFHENAHRAAEAAMFAHDKGMFAHDRDKFWQMHDIMFEHSDALSEDDLLNYAEKIGLSRSELKAALDSGKFKEIVDEQAREANRLGLKGTPSFLINGEQLLGAQPLEKFKAKVDEALRKAQ